MKISAPTKRLEERRIKAVRRVLAGETPTQVARDIKVHRVTVSDWVGFYRKYGGWDGVRARPKNGRPRLMTEGQHRELDKLLIQGAARHGFDTDLWDCKRVRDLIERSFGISYHVDHVPRILRRLGFTPQKPEHRAYERDEKKIAEWIKKDWKRIKKIA